MAHFARLNDDNEVLYVVVVNNDILLHENNEEQESMGVQFLRDLYKEQASIWKQTSYNTRENTHTEGGTPFRKNFACEGFVYDEELDAFIPPKVFGSWVLNTDKCVWEPPVPRPTEHPPSAYMWNESTVSWDLT